MPRELWCYGSVTDVLRVMLRYGLFNLDVRVTVVLRGTLRVMLRYTLLDVLVRVTDVLRVRYGLCYGVMFIEPLIRVTVVLRYCYGLWILCKNHILLGFCYGIVTEMDVLVTERYGVYTVTLRNVHVTQSVTLHGICSER